MSHSPETPLMQVLTVGMLRKAALVQRQTECGGEYLAAVLPLWPGGCGHCVLSWALNQLSALGGGSVQCKCSWSSRDEIRKDCLAPTALLQESFLGVSLSCSFSVGGGSLGCSYRAGELPSPRDSWGLGSCTEQLLPTTYNRKEAQMWSCSIICATNNPVPQWFMFSLCILMVTGQKDFGCWQIKLHNLHFLVEVKAKENALNSLSVESRSVVQGSVITWGMA